MTSVFSFLQNDSLNFSLCFDYGHLENFKYQFTMIDVDRSGDISEAELKLLLVSLELMVELDYRRV